MHQSSIYGLKTTEEGAASEPVSGRGRTSHLRSPLLAATALWQPRRHGAPGGTLPALLSVRSSPGSKQKRVGPQQLPLALRELFPNSRHSPEHDRGGSVLCDPPDYDLVTS